MATKPTIADSRWATDLSNNTPPSSGQRDTGWTPNQVAVSDYFNVLGNEAYKWFQYLDDGLLSGKFGLGSQIEVTSTGTQNDFAPTGIATASVLNFGNTSLLTITGITGGAPGRVLVMFNDGSADVVIEHANTGSAAANRFILPNGKRLRLRSPGTNVHGAVFVYKDDPGGSTDRWYLVGTTARVNRTRTVAVGNAAVNGSCATSFVNGEGWLTFTAADGKALQTIEVEDGEEISSVQVRVDPGSDGSISAELFLNGTSIDSATSSGGSEQTLTLDLNDVMDAADRLVILMTVSFVSANHVAKYVQVNNP